MNSYFQRQDRRDKRFKDQAIHVSRSSMYYMQEWIQQEVQALQPRIEMLAGNDEMPDAFEEERTQALSDINSINFYELREAVRKFDDVCERIEGDDNHDPYQHYHEVQDSIWRLEQIARRLIDIRTMTLTWWDEEEPNESEEVN